MGLNGSTTAADLNLGAGGDDIFMHVYKHLAGSPAQIYTEGQLHDAVAITEGTLNLKLMSNITLSKGLVIGDIDHGRSNTVTLDLNGYTLNRGLTTSTFLGSVIRVEPWSTLTLNDGSAGHTGTITGGRTQQSGGGICNHGTLTVNGCTITGCTADSYGGGIVCGKLTSYSSYTYYPEMHLNGTTITNCQSTSGGGLGVINYAGDGLTNAFVTGCTFSNNVATNEGGAAINFTYLKMENCTVLNNTAADVGGVYNAAGGTAEVYSCTFTGNNGYNGAGALANASNAGTMYLANNTITGNTAGTRGAGIWNASTINMSGSHTITGNTAAGNGGGIYNGGTLNVAGGTLVVNNNTKGSEANNLYLDGGRAINVTGAFDAASNIHVSAANLTAPLTSGYSTHHPGVDPSTLFTADNGRDITLINNEVFQTATLNVEVASYAELLTAVNNTEYNLINITMTADITPINGLTVTNNKIITVDLNGHTLNCTSVDHAFTVNSGNQLTITDGSTSHTGTITGTSGGAIVNAGTFILNAGTFTGATGGAIVNSGTFTLNAGTFTGNSTTGHGAALWNGSGATAIINSCSITSNTASGNSAAIWNDGYLTMNSGSITGNTASYGGIYDGGMLYVQGDVVISGNTTNGTTPRNVWLPTGKTINLVGALTTGASIGFDLENPSRALTTGYGTYNATTDPDLIFTADNGYDPSFINNEVYIVNITTVHNQSELSAAMQSNAIITLANDIPLTSDLRVTDSRNITIDLNGHTIDRGLYDIVLNADGTGGSSSVFFVHGGSTLTIIDGSDNPATPEYDGTGVIRGGNAFQLGGGICNQGTFILDGGTLKENKGRRSAAAIFNYDNSGTVYLNRGIICNNLVYAQSNQNYQGGAICNWGTLYVGSDVRIENNNHTMGSAAAIYNQGTLTMTGGSITNNIASGNGGAIWNNGTCTISGNAVISNNRGDSEGSIGGGVYNTGTCTISGNVIISNNSCGGYGGGVYNIGTVTVSDHVVISGNYAWYGGGIYNHDNGTLNITSCDSITRNTAGYGGGINNQGTLNMQGGYITGNTSTGANIGGGGIRHNGTLNMQGNPVISGNTSNANGDDDVYLKNDHNITVTGAFTEGAHINVLSETPTAVIASGYSTYNAGTDPNHIFVSKLGYHMKLDADGNVIQNVPVGKWTDDGNYSNSFSHEGNWTVWIHNEAEFARLARYWNQYSYYCCNIILEADLDMSAHEWTPLGSDGTLFLGTFEGNGHTINGIYVNTEGNAGLFASVKGKRGWSYGCCSFGTDGGCDHIRNVTLTNAYIKGTGDVGGIAGYVCWETTIENCVVEGTIIGGNRAGGIVGIASGESYYSGSKYNIPYIRNNLFKDGTVTATGNRGTILGAKANNYVDCSRSYYVNPASATGNSSDVRAYRVTKDIPAGIAISYNTSSQGIIHHDTLYYPAGTVHFNVTNDLSLNITSVQVNGTEIATTWGDYEFTIDPNTAVAYEIKVITEPSDYDGQGTEANPYEIATTEQWNTMVTRLESGGAINNYSGQYFKLMENITISTMMGSDAHRFKGNFDGNGHTLTLAYGDAENYLAQQCAPFLRIDNATIKNLTVAGHIYSSAMLNAGFVGQAYGSGNHIQNCVSNVSIHSNKNGDCSNGGFVGKLDTNGTRVTFVGCAFTGELLGENATDWSGFVAWRSNYTNNGNEVSFSHCLFAPTTVNISDGGNNHTFCRATKVAGSSYNNCYYATVLQNGDGGKQAYSITPGTGVTVANAADAVATYSVSGITAYNTGFKRNNVLYAANGQSLSLNLSGAAYNRYIASAGSLAGTENPYTLTMAGSNTVISAWVPSQPTEIATVNDWIEFCTSFNYFDDDYAGVTVNMTADVGPVSTMVGTAAHPFKGTFNGNGHTLTIGFGTEDAYYSEECAPFFRIQNATIENLVIEGSIYGAAMHNGGLVNEAFGNGNLIRNCVSRVSLHSNRGNDCSNAGFVGELNSNGSLVTFQGCAFTGEMVGPGARNWGGFVGWRYWETNNHNSVSFANCLCAPTTVEIDVETSGSNSRVFSRSTNNTTEGATYTNCYYTRLVQAADGGKQARSITAVPDVSMVNAGEASSSTTLGVVGYGTGIKFENVNYAANEENVSLTLNYTGAHTDMVQGFSASNGTLTGSQNPYTLAMPNKDVTVYYNLQRTIAGYDDDGDGEGEGKWAFIASPVAEGSAPTSVGNLIGDTIQTEPVLFNFDLYRLNPTSVMWENYNNLEHRSNFRLENGHGYLYATKETKTLVFIGAYNSGTSKGITGLPAGFNLVGNPFIVDAYVNKPYYTLNGDGSAILSETTSTANAIPPCYGVIVELDGTENVIFTTTQQNANNGGNLNIVLSQAVEPSDPSLRGTKQSSTLDNAIVTFNEGTELGKYYFGEQNANIYIPQGGKDYAIASVSDGRDGVHTVSTNEIPVNFKATENGSYTITVAPEGVEMAYLHLIDNRTGADVDLLASPEYIFTAKTTDYESRFKLVFVANNEDGASAGSGTFAFYSNGNWIVLNEGRATLQVIDVTGRILSSETVNGNVSKAINATPGVYVLRLVNGEDVKTQKIVVR